MTAKPFKEGVVLLDRPFTPNVELMRQIMDAPPAPLMPTYATSFLARRDQLRTKIDADMMRLKRAVDAMATLSPDKESLDAIQTDAATAETLLSTLRDAAQKLLAMETDRCGINGLIEELPALEARSADHAIVRIYAFVKDVSRRGSWGEFDRALQSIDTDRLSNTSLSTIANACCYSMDRLPSRDDFLERVRATISRRKRAEATAAEQ